MKVALAADTGAHVKLGELLFEVGNFLSLALLVGRVDAQRPIVVLLRLVKRVLSRIPKRALAAARIHLYEPF